MSDENIMDDYIRECWNQDPDTWTPEEKEAVKKTIDFASYQLQKTVDEATTPLIEKLEKCCKAWNRLFKLGGGHGNRNRNRTDRKNT